MNYDLYLGGGGSADAVARTVSEAQEISFWPSLGLVDNGKNYEKKCPGRFLREWVSRFTVHSRNARNFMILSPWAFTMKIVYVLCETKSHVKFESGLGPSNFILSRVVVFLSRFRLVFFNAIHFLNIGDHPFFV